MQFGTARVIVEKAALEEYGRDHTEDLVFPPAVVLKPVSTVEVSWILKFAFDNNIPVVPVGARTGLSGGILNIYSGIALSLEKMNQIVSIDEQNLQVIVEPGVITQTLQEAVAAKGLFYPVDPSSRGSCFIGGNIAENAGGARAVKYGVTKDYVLNLEVVLANGDIIWTAANTLKNATGYNLTQVIVGSEGTLGVVTKIVLRLLPAHTNEILMLVPFYRMEEAAEAVSAIFRAGVIPSALEFMERDAIDWSLRYIDDHSLQINKDIQAHLLIEVDGNYPDVLFAEAEKIAEVLTAFKTDEILFADTVDQKNALWKLRRNVAEAVKSQSVYKEEDTVVPRFELPTLLKGIKAIGDKYGFRSICYGHAGDGNLHVNIIKEQLSDLHWQSEIPKGIREIFELTVALKGTISGEHGIGYVQKNYMDIPFSNIELELMKGIKKVFDPSGILNPGKIFPDS
ncbi:FAD-binding protein [Flavobacterium sp. NKUCC04_CG]|nr:FAD-linked oxidase C-terminal domain-containing protein [Flavobacterium sp. NKUCC04_CG]MBW3519585.1 FAD-binding protein [Flavobacterium sp. NKUCC04_CG]